MTNDKRPPEEEGLELPPALGGVVDRLRQSALDDEAVARIAGRIGPVLGDAPAEGSVTSTAVSSARMWMTMAGALAVVAIGGIAYFGTRGEAPASERPSPERSVPEQRATPIESRQKERGEIPSERASPPMNPEGDETPSAAPEPTVPEPNTARARPRSRTRQPTPPAPIDVETPEATGPSEIALLMKARRALPANPLGALATIAELMRRYPDGALIQEREVVAIEALLRSGQRERAERRAQAFRRRFPASIHQRGVADLFRMMDSESPR